MNDRLIKKLKKAATNWRRSLYEVGTILLELQRDRQPIEAIIDEILHGQFGMPRASAQVALRWAAGEFGEERTARQLVAKVPHSTLAAMPSEVAAEIVCGRHLVHSAEEDRPVELTFRQMTRRTLARNLRPRGYRKIEEVTAPPPTLKPARAVRVQIGEQGQIEFIGGGRDRIKMRVSPELMTKAIKLMQEAVCAA